MVIFQFSKSYFARGKPNSTGTVTRETAALAKRPLAKSSKDFCRLRVNWLKRAFLTKIRCRCIGWNDITWRYKFSVCPSSLPSIQGIYILYMYDYVHVYLCVYMYYIALHYITLHYITLHYVTLHYITSYYITFHCITSRRAASRHVTSGQVRSGHSTAQHSTSHYNTYI